MAAFAMLVTSSDAAGRRLGRSWRRLHLAGLVYLWGIYAFTDLGRVVEDASYLPGLQPWWA